MSSVHDADQKWGIKMYVLLGKIIAIILLYYNLSTTFLKDIS